MTTFLVTLTHPTAGQLERKIEAPDAASAKALTEQILATSRSSYTVYSVKPNPYQPPAESQ